MTTKYMFCRHMGIKLQFFHTTVYKIYCLETYYTHVINTFTKCTKIHTLYNVILHTYIAYTVHAYMSNDIGV